MSCANEATHHIALAENRQVGSVTMCGCGTVHLSLGAISLRVSPDVLVEMTLMLQSAANNLVRHSRELETAAGLVH